MKTAFSNWHKRIAPLFDTAEQIHVIEVESAQIIRETQETLASDSPVQRALSLSELHISTLVCGAISRPLYEMVSAYGIKVIPFVTGELSEVVDAWLNGNLEDVKFAMPGCLERRNFSKAQQGNGKMHRSSKQR